jgi:glycosyltransferase involved in cell wall biosynthesis
VAGTLVFIPAWNEESSLPGVLAEARESLPGVELLVVDDGSTDETAAAARAGGADVVSFGENRGLREGIAEGYRQALERGYDYCGRLDADGQHPAAELARMIALVRARV